MQKRKVLISTIWQTSLKDERRGPKTIRKVETLTPYCYITSTLGNTQTWQTNWLQFNTKKKPRPPTDRLSWEHLAALMPNRGHVTWFDASKVLRGCVTFGFWKQAHQKSSTTVENHFTGRKRSGGGTENRFLKQVCDGFGWPGTIPEKW